MPAEPAVVGVEAVETQVVDDKTMDIAAAYHSQRAHLEQTSTDSQPPPGYFEPVASESEKVINTIPEESKVPEKSKARITYIISYMLMCSVLV